MYIQCNNTELVIVNLDTINVNFDSTLLRGLKEKKCLLISSDIKRRSYFKENLSDVKIWIDLFNGDFDIRRDLVSLLNDNHTNPYECVFITGEKRDVEFVHQKHISVVLLNNEDKDGDDRHFMPDFSVDNENELAQLFSQDLKGYFNEIVFKDESGTGIFKLFKIKHSIFDDFEADLIFGGRFFVDTDPRRYIHPLTQAIRVFKFGNKKLNNSFSLLLSKNLNIVENNVENIDLITAVPPKPSKENLFKPLFQESHLVDYASKLDLDILRTNMEYKPQKSVGSFANRAINVLGKFSSRENIHGHVVLIDDIVTSGSTTLECAKVLYENGADKVTIICFAAQQSHSQGKELEELKCDCGHKYRLRFNYDKGSAFWGCSNYPTCKNTMTYNIGKVTYNELIQLDDFRNDNIFNIF
ncbi:ComF family protein [Oceanobacillus kapialis]|uniref:Phosphoribosyltransferase domain-containing protein n=1 Tax=Oceanobacillus kapialis TaxID=481353 RepID=A0ABW5PZL0_9BACI